MTIDYKILEEMVLKKAVDKQEKEDFNWSPIIELGRELMKIPSIYEIIEIKAFNDASGPEE